MRVCVERSWFSQATVIGFKKMGILQVFTFAPPPFQKRKERKGNKKIRVLRVD